MAAMIIQLLISEIPKGLLKTEREVLASVHYLNPWISLLPWLGIVGLSSFCSARYRCCAESVKPKPQGWKKEPKKKLLAGH